MKERLLSIVGALIMVMPMMAQDANALQNVSVGELNYTVKEQDKTAVETVVGAVLDVLAEQTTTEQPGYADAVRASVVAALGNVRRFVVTDMREVAPTDALEGLRSKVTRFYNSAYPYTAHILERGTEKKDKQKELYIDLGAQHGLRAGTHFDVYIIGSIGGKETRKQIGRLRVKDIEGDEVSLCKVTSGGKDIKAALDAEKQLLIISTD